jgi:hypothetical protein
MHMAVVMVAVNSQFLRMLMILRNARACIWRSHNVLVLVNSVSTTPTAEELSPAQNCSCHQLQYMALLSKQQASLDELSETPMPKILRIPNVQLTPPPVALHSVMLCKIRSRILGACNKIRMDMQLYVT